MSGGVSGANAAPRMSGPFKEPPPIAAPDWWAQACAHLAREDRVMRRLIARHGSVGLQTRGDAFLTLARSIVGQQISVKAAQSVWDRFTALLPAIEPVAVLALTPEAMRAAGLSARKVQYLQELARHFCQGRVRPENWPAMSDEAIIGELIALRGIGRWTAEMFLIFHLMRPNVLPLDDIGLVKAVSQSYFGGEAITRADIRDIARAWQPWCSAATWHLWRSLDPLPVTY